MCSTVITVFCDHDSALADDPLPIIDYVLSNELDEFVVLYSDYCGGPVWLAIEYDGESISFNSEQYNNKIIDICNVFSAAY